MMMAFNLEDDVNQIAGCNDCFEFVDDVKYFDLLWKKKLYCCKKH